MVVEKILKELTPERIKKEIEEVQNVVLPAELQRWVDEYEKVGGRDGFIWKWAYVGWQIFTLSCVEKKYQKSVVTTKMCCTILNALLDDLADKTQNKKLLIKASNFISNTKSEDILNSLNKKDSDYLLLIKKIWNFIDKSVKKYPRYKNFKDIFEYDYQQFLNTMKYSYLINKDPNLINLIEHEIYSSHNMKIIIGLTTDLMCSTNFNMKELGKFREVAWNIQQMGRIGNLLTTWEKEIYDNDFTSGVFAYAIDKTIINTQDLPKSKKREEIIKKITTSKVQKYYFKQWEKRYNQIYHFNKDIKSVDIKKILDGSKKFLMMHLLSKGLEI